MALLRLALRTPLVQASPRTTSSCFPTRYNNGVLNAFAPVSRRAYASKGKEKGKVVKEKGKEKAIDKSKEKGTAKSTATLVPGSKQPITDPAAQEEYAKAEAAMNIAVDWYRKECAAVEARANGRVTPALLSPVRVTLPGEDKQYRLDELATVGVREGSTLLVTLFTADTIKAVEAALYDSKIPGVVPHRQDGHTIKIPIPKPTVDAKNELYTATKRKAEEIRVQIRKQHQASLKRGKYEKHSVELEEFQKLTDRYVSEVDKLIAGLQKAVGAR